jgi:DNA modification methylase
MKYVTDKVILAAKRLGRQYIGIDVDEDYIKIAKEKLVELS